MSQRIISTPTIEINDVKYAVYGNSVTYDQGLPDITVTSLVSGPNSFESLHSTDGTTAVGMLKFKLPTTAETDAVLPLWKGNVGTNVVKLYEGTLEKTMLNASYSEGRELEANAADGGVEVTFKGDAMDVA